VSDPSHSRTQDNDDEQTEDDIDNNDTLLQSQDFALDEEMSGSKRLQEAESAESAINALLEQHISDSWPDFWPSTESVGDGSSSADMDVVFKDWLDQDIVFDPALAKPMDNDPDSMLEPANSQSCRPSRSIPSSPQRLNPEPATYSQPTSRDRTLSWNDLSLNPTDAFLSSFKQYGGEPQEHDRKRANTGSGHGLSRLPLVGARTQSRPTTTTKGRHEEGEKVPYLRSLQPPHQALEDQHRGAPAGPRKCSCLNLCAHLLEELGANSARKEPAPMDVLLGVFRDALRRCEHILGCEECSSRAENNMLLAMAALYMSVICCQIVACYLKRHADDSGASNKQRSKESFNWPLPPPLSQKQPVSSSSSDSGIQHCGTDKTAGGEEDMWFSTYRIKSTLERKHVLTTLIMVQLAEFLNILETLRDRASSRSGQEALITEAIDRHRLARSMLRESLSRM
jgi:hypothetical protein